jgi:hypothetical protein
LAAVGDFDHRLGGIVRALPDTDHSRVIHWRRSVSKLRKDSIKANAVLLVGVGDEHALSLETMIKVGIVGLRNAMLSDAMSVAFAAALQDQNVKKLEVGDVASAVVTGALLASDTGKRLRKRGLLPDHSIDEAALHFAYVMRPALTIPWMFVPSDASTKLISPSRSIRIIHRPR